MELEILWGFSHFTQAPSHSPQNFTDKPLSLNTAVARVATDGTMQN